MKMYMQMCVNTHVYVYVYVHVHVNVHVYKHDCERIDIHNKKYPRCSSCECSISKLTPGVCQQGRGSLHHMGGPCWQICSKAG